MAAKVFKSVILGAPASGKGTISARIVKSFNLVHISSGDKLRLQMQDKTPLGQQAQGHIQAGGLVPDDLMIAFILDELRQVDAQPWLLDGFPRTVAQAERLWAAQRLDAVLSLRVPFDVIVERARGRRVHLPSGRVYNTEFAAPRTPGRDDLTGEPLVQRDDDRPDVVRRRLEQYEAQTRPVVDFYRQVGVLEEFAGRTSDEIWPKVLGFLATRLPTVEANK